MRTVKGLWIGLLSISIGGMGLCRTSGPVSRVSASPKERRLLWYQAKLKALQYEVHRLDSLLRTRSLTDSQRLVIQRVRNRLEIEWEEWEKKSPEQVHLPSDSLRIFQEIRPPGLHPFSLLPREPRLIVVDVVGHRWQVFRPYRAFRMVLLPVMPQNFVDHPALYVCIVAYQEVRTQR